MPEVKKGRSLRVELGGPSTDQLDAIKERVKIETDSETVRYIINYTYDHLVKGKVFPGIKITGDNITIELGHDSKPDE